MPKTGGNSRPVGRPGWFLLSASDTYFKRAWANTFDFLPPHWQNQHQSASRRAFNLSRPRASHFTSLFDPQRKRNGNTQLVENW